MSTKYMYGVLLGLILILFCGYASSQEMKLLVHKNSFAFIAGVGIPFSNYGNSDIYNQEAGMAQEGPLFEISYQREIKNDIGISILYKTQFNRIDKDAIVNSLNNSPVKHIYKVSVDKWEINSIMLGAFTRQPLDPNNRFSALLQFHAGLSIVTLPDLEAVYENKDGHKVAVNNNIYKNTASSLSCMFGAGFQYSINQKFALLMKTELFYAKPRFEPSRVVDMNGNSISLTRGNFSYSQNISIAALCVGFEVFF